VTGKPITEFAPPTHNEATERRLAMEPSTPHQRLMRHPCLPRPQTKPSGGPPAH